MRTRDLLLLAYSAFGGFRAALSEVRVINLAEGASKIFPMRTSVPSHFSRISSDGSVLAYRDWWYDGRVQSYVVREEETSGREVCGSFFPLSIIPVFPLRI